MTNQGEEFVRQVGAFIERERLAAEGSAVLVGVSGGPDSVALSAAMRSLGKWPLELIHVHHGLRGAAADADAEFVARLAADWQLPLVVERIDTPELARRWAVGTEEAARRGRYEVFAKSARRLGAKAVAVAHHADDQAETVLHRIIRGTHLRGLAGMSPIRPLADGVSLIRPLLWARREQIEQYCREAGLSWRTDHTNLQNDYTRNFIRNELLPLLRQRLNPRSEEALLRLSAAAGQAEAALEEIARRLFERACRKSSPQCVVLRVAPLRKSPPALACLVLRIALAAVSAPEKEMNQDRFENLLGLLEGQAGGIDLPGAIRAERRGQSIWVYRAG